MGWLKLFLSLHFAGSLSSIFWSREVMVWKKILVEEFQDGCYVHGHLWCVNGMIFAFSEKPLCRQLSLSFCSREYMVWKKLFVKEFQDGCIVHGHLWCMNGTILAISESPYCWKPSIIILIKTIYGLEEDAGWNIPKWLFSAWPSLMCEWDDFCFFWMPLCQKPSSSFCSRDYMVWK